MKKAKPKRQLKAGDWIKRYVAGRLWRGKIRRIDWSMQPPVALCEWKHTDICTWADVADVYITRFAIKAKS